MRWFDVLTLRVRALAQRDRVDAELDRELRAHLEHQIEDNIARGMTPNEARRAAMSTFGGVENVREEARDARGVAIVENIVRDLRYTLRALMREPMLLVAATLSIALGAGGNIAVFSLARAFVFAAPDVRDPGTLVTMRVSHGSHASYKRWLDLDASGTLAGIAGYSIEENINWLDDGAATSIVPLVVTANFFDVTGVPLLRGRGFTAAEARAELDPHLAVVSYEFWQRALSNDQNVVGRSITLNGESYTILGVLPPRLRSVVGFAIAPSIYVPLSRSIEPKGLASDASVVQLIGRLKPGQTVAEARVAVDAVDRRLARLANDTLYGGVQEFAKVGSLSTTKQERTVGAFFFMLGLLSFFVLLIACANVAGLLIARGTRRRQEIAIRLAIGGTRSRIVQQLLIEGVWLALIGTATGVALSLAFMRVVNSLSLPIPLPLALHLAVDGAVLAWALGVVVVTVLTCALLPALSATRLTLVPALKHEEAFHAIRRVTMRGALLVGQVMVSTILLVTAFLFVRNLARSEIANPGFEVRRGLVAQLGFLQGRADAERVASLQAAVDRVRAMPGIEAAAYAAAVPLTVYSGSSNGLTARIDGEKRHVEFSKVAVGPGYFATLGISLVAGREFQAADAPGTPKVAIVNDAFARRYIGGANPIGKRVEFLEEQLSFEIVGVVANSKMQSLGEELRPAFYLPLRQNANDLRIGFVVARATGEPTPLLAPVRLALGEMDRSMSVTVDPMSSALQFALFPSRVGAAVLGTLGILGLVLAAFGLYAIVAYNVSRRVAEIAIRSALGASRGAILALVIRDASIQVGIGLVLGLGLSALVTSPLATFLVAGLSTTDPLSFAGTAALFLAVSVLASLLPARSATRVSPAVAMRLD